jgi:CrcB protein
MSWACVIGFGVIGAGFRFAIDSWIAKRAFSFPVGTLFINIVGCLIAGLCLGFGQKDLAETPIRLGIIVGFCGGFTTFSGYGLQFLQLVDSGKMSLALILNPKVTF